MADSTMDGSGVASEPQASSNNTSVDRVALAKKKKKTPPESADGIATRRWILFSFWAVALFLGLPVWLWTTSVPRSNLPLQSMNQWADGQVMHDPVLIW